MIVRVIPETELEKQNMKTIEHTGVREFMIFGNKKDPDGLLIDFHEWSGQYRYLIGGMYYFADVLNDERRERVNTIKNQESHRSVMASVPSVPSVPSFNPPNLQVVEAEDIPQYPQPVQQADLQQPIPFEQQELDARVELIQEDIDND